MIHSGKRAGQLRLVKSRTGWLVAFGVSLVCLLCYNIAAVQHLRVQPAQRVQRIRFGSQQQPNRYTRNDRVEVKGTSTAAVKYPTEEVDNSIRGNVETRGIGPSIGSVRNAIPGHTDNNEGTKSKQVLDANSEDVAVSRTKVALEHHETLATSGIESDTIARGITKAHRNTEKVENNASIDSKEYVENLNNNTDSYITSMTESAASDLNTNSITMYNIPQESLYKLFEAHDAAKMRNIHGNFALIQMLDHGYVNMTKHWVCNTHRMGDVLGSTVFVATDTTAYNALTQFDRDLNVVLIPFVTQQHHLSELKYGQVVYYELMRFRTEILLRLLSSRRSTMLVESDAYWSQDVVGVITSKYQNWESMDMICASDSMDKETFQGGFHLNLATPKTVALWGGLFYRMNNIIDKLTSQHGYGSDTFVADEGSEQTAMQKLIKSKAGKMGMNIQFLPNQIVSSGQWYQKKYRQGKSKQPSVILNNYTIGNTKKVKRASKWNHYFYDVDTDQCLNSSQTLQLFRATIVVMTMARPESLQRLLASIANADYAPLSSGWGNDVRLLIRVDQLPRNRKKREQLAPGFTRVVEIARSFKSDKFSDIQVEVNQVNMGLKEQWFTSFQRPRGWDEVGIIFEDDVQVSPHYFRYLQAQWLDHGFRDSRIASISLQRQTLRASDGAQVPIVNSHKPFLSRLVGTWGFSAKASTWLQFTNSYRYNMDVLIPGLVTSQWQAASWRSMWSQHFIHFSRSRNQFTQYINLPDNKTLCANWREDGEHSHNSSNATADFPVYDGDYKKELFEQSLGGVRLFGFDNEEAEA